MAAQVPRKREETLKAVGRTERPWGSWEEGLGVRDTLWKERGAEVRPETQPGHEEQRGWTRDSRISRATGPPPLTSLRGAGVEYQRCGCYYRGERTTTTELRQGGGETTATDATTAGTTTTTIPTSSTTGGAEV